MTADTAPETVEQPPPGELQPPSMSADPAMFDRLTASGMPEEAATILAGEQNPDHVLANLSDEEVDARRIQLETQRLHALAMFPPRESVLRGDVRRLFGLPGPYVALDPATEHAIVDSFHAAYDRVTRSRGGWQQELLRQFITEQRSYREDATTEDDDAGGWLGGLFGGGR